MTLIEILQSAHSNGEKCHLVLYYESLVSGLPGLSTTEIRERLIRCRVRQVKKMNISDVLSRSNHLVDRSKEGVVHKWHLTPTGVEHVRAILQKTFGKVPDLGGGGRAISSKKISILFLGLAPIDTDRIRIDKETREIEEKLRASEYRDAFQFHSKWAVRTKDLFQHLHEIRPDILHISGHGTELGEIAFEDDNGNSRLVAPIAIAQAIGSIDTTIRIALLNLCFSNNAARELSAHIDCAIGMAGPIHDDSAVVLASSFYRSLGFGKSAVQAFREARASLVLEGLPDDHLVELYLKHGTESDHLRLL